MYFLGIAIFLLTCTECTEIALECIVVVVHRMYGESLRVHCSASVRMHCDGVIEPMEASHRMPSKSLCVHCGGSYGCQEKSGN